MRRANNKLECKVVHWRNKSKEQTKIIEAQNRTLKRRDARIAKDKEEKKALRYENAKLKKRVSRLEKQRKQDGLSSSTPVRHHSYDAELIQLCLRLRSASGCSYRGCVHVLKVLVLTLGLNLKIPSIGSIRNWEIKYGYHNLGRSCDHDNPWALILDESISIGSEKLLLLIGVDLKAYDFKRPLSHSDVRVLDVRLGKSWKAEDIDSVIEGVKARGYNLSYACSDSGNNLCKALKLSGLRRIADCGHKFGHWLKITYQDDEEFLSFRQRTTTMKKRLILSKHAELVPPKLRAKGRYLNISPIAKWATATLKLAEKYAKVKKRPAFFDEIAWLLEYREFILKISREQNLIDQVNKVLKKEGLSQSSARQCRKLVKQSEVCESLRQYIENYLSENLALLDTQESLVCSSDVIESIFGLFKHRNSTNPCSSITQSCLTIASYGEKADVAEVKKAMEGVLIVDLEKWKLENLSETVAQKRRKMFQKTG